MKFDEHALELSIIELFKDEGYSYLKGADIAREKSAVLLENDIKQYLSERYDELTSDEIDSIVHKLHTLSGSLYEANKSFMRFLTDGFIFTRADCGQKDIYINLINVDTPTANIFKIVNQVEIQGYEQTRIPDAILYVNGLPLVVFEFKTAINENTTIMDAYTQLTVRYKRDIPNLFIYNAFTVISDGVNNKYGSFFSPYDFFYAWRKIESSDKDLDGIDSLVTLVKGLFRKDRLLAVIKNFIYFPDQSHRELKIVCRYPQFFAATKLLDNVKLHIKPEGDGKGGTYFGATGCGKSYTMLFLTRMIMKNPFFKSPTIVIITDRTDLDDQLSAQFTNSKTFIDDEKVVSINSREALRQELNGRTSGGVFLTTIQKFSEDISLLSDRSNIICISDEAHRSQVNFDQKVRVTSSGVQKKYGFAKYLHDSLPNATYVGFTGTPIDATIKVFGEVVEAYTMTESVKDGITVNLVYEGRAAKVALDSSKVQEIEEYYARCAEEGANEYQIEESKKAVAHLEAILGDTDRLTAVAKDFIEHYENRVKEGATAAGKAMFVCANRKIAFKFYQMLIKLRPEWGKKKLSPDGVDLTEKEKKELKPIEKVCMVMTRNKDDESELFNLLGNKDDRKELDRQFKNIKSNFKIAIVVDMWLTGFDVPFLDAIYIDKPIKQHTLIQTISRVNRVYAGKDKGLIVDYIGIKKNMNIALAKYTNFESDTFEGVEKSVTIVKDQLDVLKKMFHRFDDSKYFTGTPKEQLYCLNRAVEHIQSTEELERRFMAVVKRLKQAFSLCVSSEEISDIERDRIHFYIAVRSILFKLTKGDAPDISKMNAHVQKMVEDAILSDGIEELFSTGKDVSVDLFSEDYLEKISQIKLKNTKIKLLQRLLSNAIEEFKKVNKIKGLEFSERLQQIVDSYNNRRGDEAFANEVLDDVASQLADLLHELKEESKTGDKLGINFEEKAFYDILKSVAKKFNFEYPKDKMIFLSKEIKKIVDDKSKYADCFTRDDIKAELQADLIIILDDNGYPPVAINDAYKEVLEQAENFKKHRENS
ncbi:MAG: type I restriction endonuclease subunit R [Selenomonadaceae bacterium]|nr:type I restriction endonuclease subunit R [Selenomonadaceae bacterium]